MQHGFASAAYEGFPTSKLSILLILHNCSGMVVRGDGPELVIDRLQYSNEGNYECRATNVISAQKRETKSKFLEVIK